MALKDAEHFIREVVKADSKLRESLYQYETSAEVMAAIKENGYPFKLYEFEESINYLKTISPTEEQAIMLDELLMWWNMMMLDGTIKEEASSCSPSKCGSCKICG